MLRVSAIQLNVRDEVAPQEFFDNARVLIERAAHDGAQLIVLPNLAAPIARDEYVDFFSLLARRLQIHLAPGTLIEREGSALSNVAYLFAHDGRVIGNQKQTHRSPQEIARGFARGDELNVFDIGVACVGFVIGTDVEYPEVSRILALQGANVLIHPASYAPWSNEHFLLDLWRDVQANQVFGVQACGAGKGRSAIYAPVETLAPNTSAGVTSDHRGFLAQANGDAEEIVSATFDFDALQKVIDDYPIFSFFNYEFYAQEFPKVYHSSSRSR